MTMPPGTLREMRRLAELIDRSEELKAQSAERRSAAAAEHGPIAAWVLEARADCSLIEAERLRAEFAEEAADLWPLLMMYAEAWSGRRAA